MRWLFYQSLLGVWDPEDIEELPRRLADFMLKAAREAKLATSWTRENAEYEAKLTGFVERAFADNGFLEAFEASARPFIAAGARKSLVQTALKLLMPGVPDIYQGTAWADLSLVDPDNRRPVDFEARQAALERRARTEKFNAANMGLLRRLLALRAEVPALFAKGQYSPLEVSSPSGRYLGTARFWGETIVLVLAELSPPPERREGEPRFRLPPKWQGSEYQPVWPDAAVRQSGAELSPSDGFAGSPVVVLRGMLNR